MGRTFHSRDANTIMIAFIESEHPNDYAMQDDLQDRLLAAFANDENPELQGDYSAFRRKYLRQERLRDARDNTLLLGTIGVVIVVGFLQRDLIRSRIEENLSERWINILGFTGGFMQLGAVLAVSRGWLTNTSVSYHGLSFIGSSGLLLNAFYYGANPAVVINIIWMAMNVVGLVEGLSNTALLDDLGTVSTTRPVPA